jgi:NAD(P) transhydrogenase subunit alpha
MSGANAISGITVVGALMLSNVALTEGDAPLAAKLAFVALVLATINAVGGFLVTNRMLQMIAGRRRK